MKVVYNDVYNDQAHSYYLGGKRAKYVTAVAKIPADTYAIEQWEKRQVAIGLAMDRNLIENVAVDIDNRDALNNICDEAKKVAGAHRQADRGTQKHRVLELVLLEQEHKMLTDQQRLDAEVLKRTLDLHKLTLHDGMAEQFVAWPHYTVTGRFDAVLEKPDGTFVLVDLKSAQNAILYPHSTAVQLALYPRAPRISDGVHTAGDRSTVTDWRTMSTRLEYRYAYVLVEHDAIVGTPARDQHVVFADRLGRCRCSRDCGRRPEEIHEPLDHIEAGLPRTLIHVSGSEVLLHDVRLAAQRAGSGRSTGPAAGVAWPDARVPDRRADGAGGHRSLCEIGNYTREATRPNSHVAGRPKLSPPLPLTVSRRPVTKQQRNSVRPGYGPRPLCRCRVLLTAHVHE